METYKNFMMVFAGINIFVWIIGLGRCWPASSA